MNEIFIEKNINNKENLNPENWFELIEIIPLEYSKNIAAKNLPDNLIGSISQVFLLENTFFIVDKKTTSIKIFNGSGKYTKDILPIGKGPGELTDIGSVVFDQSFIQIYSNEDMKVIRMTYEGDLIQENRIPFFAKKMESFRGGLAFYINFNSS